jgi:exonuclease III
MLCLLFYGNIETCPDRTYRNEIFTFCKQRGMKIIHQNIRGLQSNFNLLQELIHGNDFDIITLSETHLVNSGFNDINDLYELPDYTFIKRNREHGQGGGVTVYIKTN